MIRESLKVGTQYAVLHGSVHDRSKARPFEITAIPVAGGDVLGYFHDVPEILVTSLSVRLVRSTWHDWVNEVDIPFQAYRRQDPADWLRRIAKDEDASPALQQAALDQLATIRHAA